MKKKLGLFVILMVTLLLTACREVAFEPVTVDGFVVTTTFEQFTNQGPYHLSEERLAEILPDLNRDVQAQNFTFYLELVEMQLNDEAVTEVYLPTPEASTVVIDTKGSATFEEITFHHAGVYTFNISQYSDLVPEVWEIDHASFYITVTVTEDEDDRMLLANVHQEEVAIFVNAFTVYVGELLASLQWTSTYDEVNFDMDSEYALLINVTTGAVLFEHQADVRTFPASVTKIMTVLVGLEHGSMDEAVTVSADFEGLQRSLAMQSGFEYGEVRTFSEILHAVMLSSGGEATEALANHVAGSYDAFVHLMNVKARELGMHDTHFVTATGLHDENHYTTANDIAILLQYALEIPMFRAMFTRESYELATPNLFGDALRSTLFHFVPSLEFEGGIILGGRTGFTTPAGRCLASLATNGEEEFILITFGATDDEAGPAAAIFDALMIYSYFLQQ